MKSKRTSIRNLARVLSFDPMAQIVKAEYQYKAQSVSDEVKPIDTTTMLESIEALADNVVFSDLVDWTYKNVSDTSNTEDFIVYGDLHDSMVGTIVVMYLRVVDGHTVTHIENELNKTIFNQ
ncbi:MAG: hypothetical protein IJA10_12625 [Lachnospiraceae bacterium]|nr:hypothetical protein [Lachnospiraceae bacterium]